MSISVTVAQTQTVAETASGWSLPLSFAQFNPSLGTLTGVQVSVTGDINGNIAIENLGAATASVQAGLSGVIQVFGPGNTQIGGAFPITATTVNLGAYNSTGSFTGSAGTVIPGITSTASAMSVYSPGSVALAPFVGTGSITLTASGLAYLNETGGGNLATLSQVSAGANVSVQYDYQATVAGSGSSGGTGGSIFTLAPPIGIAPASTAFQTTAAQTMRVADLPTGWQSTLAAQKFDPALGTLEAVNLTLITDINGGFVVENLGSVAAPTAMTDPVNVTLTLPGTLATLTGTAVINTSATLGAFDGTIDFGGVSGQTLAGVTSTGTTQAQLFPGNQDLSGFIGTGTVALPILATGTSSLFSGANVATGLSTDAGATLELSFVYLPGTNTLPALTGTAPIISGTQAGQIVAAQETLSPFANVIIGEPGVGQTETVTVTLSSTIDGALTNPGGGSYDATTGIYTDAGSADAITAALRGLVFTPSAAIVTPGHTIVAGFTISDTNTALQTATDATTSVVITPGVAINTVALAQQVGAALSSGTPGFSLPANAVIACFAAGTRIATPRGHVPVERLRPGQGVLTVSGKTRAIQWIGKRTLDCNRHSTPDRVWPVRIAAHAFGQDRPKRALFLSPDHAVFVEDVLIPVKFLINGTTIAQIQLGTVTYYHIELPSHDVLLAENLPAESYLETGGRAAFENGSNVTQLHPDFTPDDARVGMVWQNFACAPLIGDHQLLEQVQARLAVQATMLELDRDTPSGLTRRA